MTEAGARILTIFSPSWRGGAGRFVREMSVAIAASGVRTTLISPLAEPETEDAGHFGVERIYLAQGKAGQGSIFARALGALGRVARTFPLLARQRRISPWYLVTMTDWLPVKLLQFMWIRLLGGRLIYVVHDATPHAWTFPRPLQGLEGAMLRWSYHLATQLVTLTGAAARELENRYGIVRQRISIIPHGAYHSGTPQPMRGDNIVLVFGMLRRNKRTLETIEAMQLLPEDSPLRLIIAGVPHADDPGYWQECQAALRHGHARIHTEIGFVSDERVAQLLDECDAMILPYEDFNSASGVASLGVFSERLLLCTDVGSMGELIEGGLEPLAVARPVTALSVLDALKAFADLPVQTRRDMAARSRAALTEHLSWQRIGKLYQALLSDQPGTGA